MSISLNRAFYRSMAEEFAGNFTSALVELVQILRADIDIKNKTTSACITRRKLKQIAPRYSS